MRRRLAALISYLGVTFGITWGWDGALALLGMRVRPGIGWPTHVPGQFGPLLGAFAASFVLGREALRVWFHRLVLVRGPVWLWAGALGAPMLVFGVGGIFDPIRWRDLGRLSGLPSWPWPLTLLALLVITGMAEEAGWRGWLLPWSSPLAAASLVSIVWALWHLPLFFSVQTYRDGRLAFVPIFFASLWCGSVALTWLWMRPGGSTPLPILWHGLYDLLGGSAASAGAAGLAVSVLVDIAGICLAIADLRLRRQGRTLFPAVGTSSTGAEGREPQRDFARGRLGEVPTTRRSARPRI
jgi:membrane protease YdiL (CAAX protease family)